MDYEAAYNAFKNLAINARKKRVPFEINFRHWCDVWGNQIDQRGKLQLQRIDKAAGYVEGNLRIGERPRRNDCIKERTTSFPQACEGDG